MPWRPVMVDLEVYRAGRPRAAGRRRLLRPARAAAVPLPAARRGAVGPAGPAADRRSSQIGWTVGGVLALLAVLHRVGLQRLGAEPRRDRRDRVRRAGPPDARLRPARHLPRRARRARPRPRAAGASPAGCCPRASGPRSPPASSSRRPCSWSTCCSSAAPRAFVVAVVSGVVLTLAAAVVVPRQSAEFWGRLAHGDTGLGAQHHLLHEPVGHGRRRSASSASAPGAALPRARPQRRHRRARRVGRRALAPARRRRRSP